MRDEIQFVETTIERTPFMSTPGKRDGRNFSPDLTGKVGPRTSGEPPAGNMVWIPGGTFLMGSNDHYPEEAPAHRVTVSGFWMDRYAVTNADFRRFVEATGHVTVAEKPANAADYPGAKPELLAPSSVLFRKAAGPVDLRDPHNWWTYIPGEA